MIKHLVLGGGGVGGLPMYGALKYLSKNNYFDINNIKSIYATSIGSLIGVLISLNYDWDSLDDYLIKRPWDKVISIKPVNIFNIWQEKGILNMKDIVNIVLSKLLTAKDLSESITLKEFYEYNSIEFHIYTININETLPNKIDISYKTHPNLELYKAIAMSANIPIIFTPIIDNSECYIDGGILINFPLNNCIENIENIGDNINNILALKIVINKGPNIISNKSNILNYLYYLINKLIWLNRSENPQIDISNLICCNIDSNDISAWSKVLTNEEIRKDMIESGIKYGEIFLNPDSIT